MACTSSGLFQVSILSLSLTLSSFPIFVAGDFSIVNRKSSNTLFQTASDLLLDGCSSFYEEANIFASPYPPIDCSVPSVVPQLKLWSQRKWVFVTLENPGCDLKNLRELAAEAGFAAIIYGTEKGKSGVLSLKDPIAERHKNQFLSENGDQGLIDVHLVHPLDIKIISQNFSFPQNRDYDYTLANNVAPQCRKVEPSAWDFHWLYFSKWAGYFWTLSRKLLIQQLNSIYQYILKRPVLLQIIIIPISLIICVPILYCIRNLLYVLTHIFQPTNFFQERERRHYANSRTGAGQNWRFHSEFEDFGFGNHRRADNNNAQETSETEVKKHCKILGIPKKDSKSLTIDQINRAFRKIALVYHPDKHHGKSETEIVELKRKFVEAKESKEKLVKHCEKRR